MDFKRYTRLAPDAIKQLSISVQPGPACDLELRTGKSIDKDKIGYESGFRIVNRTNTTIMIQDRTGPVTSIPRTVSNRPNNNPRMVPRQLEYPASPDLHIEEGFIIVTWYHTCSYTEMCKMVEHYEQFASESSIWSRTAQDIPKYMSDRFISSNLICTLVITGYIHACHLKSDTPIFLPEFGVVIGDLANRDKIYNPFNMEELIRYNSNYVENGVGVKGDPAFFRMTAYTNVENRYDRLFVRVMDTVQEVPVLYDPTGERNGIEVYEKRPIDRQGQPVKKGLMFYTFDEAFDKFELSTSIDGAYRIREDKVRELKLETEIRDANLKLATVEYNQSKLIADKEEAELKFQRETERYERELEKLVHEKEVLMLKLEQDQQIRHETAKQRDKQATLDFTKGVMGFFGQTLTLVLQIVKVLPAKPV